MSNITGMTDRQVFLWAIAGVAALVIYFHEDLSGRLDTMDAKLHAVSVQVSQLEGKITARDTKAVMESGSRPGTEGSP